MSSLEDLSTADLLATALSLSREVTESDARWECVRELHRRGETETFDMARSWCDSGDAVVRELAADLLGQLGRLAKRDGEQFRPFTGETVPLLEKLLDDPDPRVIASALGALGQHYLPAPIPTTMSHAAHPSAAVRKEVARLLGGVDTALSIDLLIKLSRDPDDDVRDWAAFGLGEMCDLDSADIREALFQRLGDSHYDTRSEALLGLAERRDDRVVPFIRKALEAQSVGTMTMEAAGHAAAAELVPALEELTTWWDVDTELLEAALKRCRGESAPEDERRWVSKAGAEG